MSDFKLEVIGKIASPLQTRAGTHISYSIFLRPFTQAENKVYFGDEIRLPVSADSFGQFDIGMDLNVTP